MTAADFLPQRTSLASLRRAAKACRGCELYENATQTVFGSGRRSARLMLVGEIPGDQEDRQGKPFVGPAGRLLHEALEKAGIAAADAYVTNAVKHFRWEQRGKRRLHKKPTGRQIEACKPWLHAEVLVVEPQVLVCLGATAAQAFLGRDFRLLKNRGKILASEWDAKLLATYHPSAVLRTPARVDRQRMQSELVEDLRRAAEQLDIA